MGVSMRKTQRQIFKVVGIVALLLTIVTLYVTILSPSSTAKMAANTPLIQPYTAENAMRDYVKRRYPNVRFDDVGCDATVDPKGFVMCRAEGSNTVDMHTDVIVAMCRNAGTPTDPCE